MSDLSDFKEEPALHVDLSANYDEPSWSIESIDALRAKPKGCSKQKSIVVNKVTSLDSSVSSFAKSGTKQFKLFNILVPNLEELKKKQASIQDKKLRKEQLA